MIFHEGFISNRMDVLESPKWFAKRAELYKEVATWVNKPLDTVYFDFSAPDCGWIDVSVYVNGEKRHQFPLTAAFDSFPDIKNWLEDIVIDTKLSSDLYLELEGRTAILHYEHVKLAEVGTGRKFANEDRDKDEWESFDANNGAPDTCLFYLYDSSYEDIPVVCYCKTKDFIFALYNGLLNYSSRSVHANKIGAEWYYMDRDDDGNPTEDNWTFYNSLKSPLIEWNHDSRMAYRHERPKFKETPTIKETVHMWAEWGDGLFWHQRGGCCGDAESFWVDTDETTVDLKDLPEVRAWYDEFNSRDPSEPWSDEEYNLWFDRGWELAKKIRQRLPLTVDLYYHWKTFVIGKTENCIEIPIVVPDDRLLIKNSSY